MDSVPAWGPTREASRKPCHLTFRPLAVDDVIVQAELTPARKHLPLSGRASSIWFVLPVFTDLRCEYVGLPFSFIAGLLCVRHHEKHWRWQATTNTLCWRILSLGTSKGLWGKKTTQGRGVLGFLFLLQPESVQYPQASHLFERQYQNWWRV